MPRGRKPKNIEASVEETTDSVNEPVVLSELDLALDRQTELLELDAKLVENGIEDRSKLAVLLGQVNQRIKELS